MIYFIMIYEFAIQILQSNKHRRNKKTEQMQDESSIRRYTF